jgi:hypothetical protein
MIKNIELYLFILSIVYLGKYIIELALRLRQDNPKEMKLSKIQEISIYLSLSYLITYILI